MSFEVEVTILDKDSSSWSDAIDQLRALLGAPRNVLLFPPHFLKATFPKIGGSVVLYQRRQSNVGVGFLFPRALSHGVRGYTIRFYHVEQVERIDRQTVIRSVKEIYEGISVVFYDPNAEQNYRKTTNFVENINVGKPDNREAVAIRRLQKEIWGSKEDFVYPADIHSVEFRTGTSLVARTNGQTVGFCFGFYKFGGSELPLAWSQSYDSGFRLESQLLGVLPEHRSRGIGFAMKKRQAEQAQNEQIDIINWTVDPLQFGNAVLNFGRLKAVSFDFYPNYYSFRNVLNTVPASRLGITWLINSERVVRSLSSPSKATVVNLHGDDSVLRINPDSTIEPRVTDAKKIAIQIPADWTALQRENANEAARWREATDTTFQQYLGPERGKYMVTGVGVDGGERYLIAEGVDDILLEQLAN